MRRMPVILLVISAGLWAGGIGADADGARAGIWVPLLAGGAVFTAAGLHELTAQRAIRVYEALTRAVLNRPFHRGDTGPLPRIELVSPRDPERETPSRRPSVPGKRRAQHASRR